MLIIAVYTMAVAVYVSVIMEFNHIHSDELEEQQLFLKMELPFDHDVYPIREIVLFIQFIQLLSNASVIGMLDAVIITLVSFSFTSLCILVV